MNATPRFTEVLGTARPVEARSRPALRVGLLTPHNPYDRQAFSGTAHHAAKALGQTPGLELRVLGPHRPRRRLDQLLRRPSPRVEAGALNFSGLDVIIGLVATPLLNAVCELTDLPLIHVTDATPAFLRDVYGYDVPAAADRAEVAAATAAATVVYSSRRMARRALQDLGTVVRDARSLPFGVNLDTLPQQCPEKKSLETLELLFIGADWDRKGGDLAVAALDALNASGRAARLTVVGRVPDRIRAHRDVCVEGFLDKNRPRDLARLTALYERAHVFVLPTKADCTPMVLAEAMAHGTPVLAHDVGGISELVGPGGAGRVLPQAARAGEWAEAIAAMTADATAFAMVSDAAFERAGTRLSWRNWADGIAEIARDVATERPATEAA